MSVVCDGCRQPLAGGLRFKCANCDDYDLCGACVDGHEHADRHFLYVLNAATRCPALVPQPDPRMSKGTEPRNVVCDLCRNQIKTGPRFKCAMCDDYDVCGACLGRAFQEHEQNHVFARFRWHCVALMPTPLFALRAEPAPPSAMAAAAAMARLELGDDYYPMRGKRRGLALLVGCGQFSGDNATALAAVPNNLRAMHAALDALGFDIVQHENVERERFLRECRQVAARDFSAYDAFVFYFSGHGSAGSIIMSDHRAVSTSDVFDCFKPEACPSLLQKPKMFFFQACRGSQHDNGVPLERGWRLPVTSDFLYAYATAEGFVSWSGSATRPSPWTEHLARNLEHMPRGEHIVDTLTRTNSDVVQAQASSSVHQAPNFTSHLTRKAALR